MQLWNKIPPDTLSLFTLFVLGAIFLAALLFWRLYLAHEVRQTPRPLQLSEEQLHLMLQHRIVLIDRWGIGLTAGLAICALALFSFSAYTSLRAITHFFRQLLSLF